MTNMIRICILCGLLLALSTNPVWSISYYVDNQHQSANNSNPGTLDQPWLTIQHAAETAVAGDTVFIRSGIYNEHVYIDQNGDTSGFIVFSGFPGETPIIDGTGVTDSQNGIIIDKSYIKLNGLEIRNWNDNGIWMENAGNVEITDCIVHDVTYGIGAANGTHDFELNRVIMYNFDLYGFDASPGDGADCYNGTFNDCIAHTGRDSEQNVDGFALGHGNQHDFTFTRCETYNVYDGFDVGENEGSKTNVLFNRCWAYNCWNDGFKLTGQALLLSCISQHNVNANVALYWGYAAGRSTLHSCTLMDSESFNIYIENSVDSLHIYNCILAGGDNIGIAYEQRNASTYQGDYNLFHNDNIDRTIAIGYEDEFSLNQIETGAWTTYSGQDVHSLTTASDTDIFIDPINFNLHLIENCIAIDHGTNVDAPTFDFDGNSRPIGSGYDIGAYEYQSAIDVNWKGNENSVPNTLKLLQNYPNPFNPTTIIRYSIAKPDYVKLSIYNLLGQPIKTLVSGYKNPGYFDVYWDGLDHQDHLMPSAIYIYKLETTNFTETKKMSFIR